MSLRKKSRTDYWKFTDTFLRPILTYVLIKIKIIIG
jgi:hypothetical protein